MDMEQLKLILELAGKAGDGAFTIAILFFVKVLTEYIVISGVIIFIVIKTFNAFKTSQENSIAVNQYNKALCEIRDIINPESASAGGDCIYSNDIRNIKEFIHVSKILNQIKPEDEEKKDSEEKGKEE